MPSHMNVLKIRQYKIALGPRFDIQGKLLIGKLILTVHQQKSVAIKVV